MDNFANYLYQARNSKGRFISQQKLAKISTYSQTYISLIETDKAKPSERCRKALTKALKNLLLER